MCKPVLLIGQLDKILHYFTNFKLIPVIHDLVQLQLY